MSSYPRQELLSQNAEAFENARTMKDVMTKLVWYIVTCQTRSYKLLFNILTLTKELLNL